MILLFRLKPDFADITKIQILYGCSVSAFEMTHRKYHTKWLSPLEQDQMVQLVKKRLNQSNPYDSDEIEFPFPIEFVPSANDHAGWTVMTLKEFHDGQRLTLPLIIPYLPEEHFHESMSNFSMSNYRMQQGMYYVTLMRLREISEFKQNYTKRSDFLKDLHKRPESMKLYFRLLSERPNGWDDSQYGV